MRYIKPEALRPGDTIAVVSPSWGGPSIFPHIYENGLRILKERFGLHVKEYPTVRMPAAKLHANPQLRAQDINNAFKDGEVKAIVASIGGDDSVRILPYIDVDAARKNPKILLGYSDTSTLLTYLNQHGLVTYHGPAVMAGFSQLESLPQQATDHIMDILFENPHEYDYQPLGRYSNGYPNWTKKNNLGKVNTPKKAPAWRWLQGSGSVKGRLFGGCIEVLEMMKGTRFWPNDSFWDEKILFFETSEDKPSPDEVKRMLRSYGIQGVYDRVSAILVGRARDYSPKEMDELDEVVISVIKGEFGQSKIPIVSCLDFGHTDPQWILPLGIEAKLDCKKKTFSLVESPCR